MGTTKHIKKKNGYDGQKLPANSTLFEIETLKFVLAKL